MSTRRPSRPGSAKARGGRSLSGGATPYEPRPDGARAVRSPRPARAAESSGPRPKVTALVIDGVAEALATILRFDGPADVLLSRFFRQHHELGMRDRGQIAEAIFHALRRYATLGWVMQPAHPLRAPRLAALIALAQQHGFDALDPRALRGDANAVRHALAVDLSRAAVPGRRRAARRHEGRRTPRSAREFDQGRP